MDPVLRCDSCQEIVKLETLHKLGVCPKCGNKRVRDVTILSVEERRKLSDWGYDEFLTEFEPKEVNE
jgi:rRNA maturation endonuclease Nob1